jgi:site-specific recombinase XerD
MEKAELSQASIANRLSALSSLFKHLTDAGLVSQSPVSGVKHPKTGNAGVGAGKSPALTRKQVQSMLNVPDTKTLQGLRDRALLHIYFYTGARCSEPDRLKVKDMRFDREYTVLDLTIKGNKRNTIAIHPECVMAIREYLEVAKHSENPETFLFKPVKNGKAGQALTRIQFYRLFDKYARLAGLPAGVYPHHVGTSHANNGSLRGRCCG